MMYTTEVIQRKLTHSQCEHTIVINSLEGRDTHTHTHTQTHMHTYRRPHRNNCNKQSTHQPVASAHMV